ncbi:hypothetical protein F444_09886 [Phytophthora nicotianae P1976]|uniref:Uncharacterized protein n=1 Tax=Phytophthora nicotianae P1976 TaxID=1317066 RepID=A0A081A647_PHYNI|nr:hypothetical protein F444_09886 [Phytophthora nicotianae P1976]
MTSILEATSKRHANGSTTRPLSAAIAMLDESLSVMRSIVSILNVCGLGGEFRNEPVGTGIMNGSLGNR